MLALYEGRLSTVDVRLTAHGMVVRGGRENNKHGYVDSGGRGIWIDYQYTDGELQISTDAFGVMPLFYAPQKNNVVVSSNIRDVMAAIENLTLDDAAIAVFLRCGYFLGNDTPFAQIHRVPPACTLRINQRGCTLSVPDAPVTRCATDLSRSAAVAAFGELFQSAINGLVPPDNAISCLPLSGGRDSRHILYGLIEAGHVPDSCVTVRPTPPDPKDDETVARAVTHYLNVPHVVLDPAPRPVTAEWKKNRLIDFCAIEHGWTLPINGYTSQANVDVFYDGIGGDILSAGLYLTKTRLDLFEQARFDALAEDIMRLEGYLPGMLSKKSYRRWPRQLAISRMSAELKRFANRNNPISEFFFENRTRRAIAPATWKIFAGSGIPVAPFLHPTVVDFLRSLPPSYVLGKSFHEDTIKHRYPRYRNLPFEDKSAPRRLTSKREVMKVTGDFLKLLRKRSHAEYIDRPYLLGKLAQANWSRQEGTNLPDTLKKPIYLMQLADVLKSR